MRGAPVGEKEEWISCGDRGDRELRCARLAPSPSLLPRACRLKPQALVGRPSRQTEFGRMERPQPRGARPAEYRRAGCAAGSFQLLILTGPDNGQPCGLSNSRAVR